MLFRSHVDLLYSDPPWNQGNVNSFVTKAGLKTYIRSFGQFCDSLFARIDLFTPEICYLEIGKENYKQFSTRLKKRFDFVQDWQIRYYNKHPCYLLRGGPTATETDFTNYDDTKTPTLAIRTDNPGSVADICTGRGLTMIAAHNNYSKFIGTELNQRRLAVAIDRAAQAGVKYEKCN